MQKSRTLLGYLLVIASAVIFGCMPLIATIILDEGIDRFSLVFFRNLFSIPILAVAAKLCGGKLKINPRALPSIAWITLFGCCLTPILLYSSYLLVDTGMATVFHFVYPAVVLLLGLIFLKSKFQYSNLISIVICIAGVFLISSSGAKIDMIGSVLALLSGITYAIYIIGLAGFRYKEISGFTFTFYGAAFCSVVSFVICLCTNKLTFPTSFKTWLLCILFALIFNVGAVILFQKGTRLIGGERASILSAFEPITGVFVGIAFRDENSSWQTLVGTVLVVAASVLIALFDMKSNHADRQK